MNFALLLNHPDAAGVFEDVVRNLPSECNSYVIGGAVRNAMYRHFFNERLRQRDYDQIITSGSQAYLAYLRSMGFENGGIVRDDQIIMSKGLVPNPDPKGYDDSVVFDMHPVDDTTAVENLSNHVGFTINGFALSIRDVFDEHWLDKIVMLPGAADDLQHKRLRLNLTGYKAEPANFFAALRFTSAGFSPPSKEELSLLLKELPNLPPERYVRNIPKVFNYVGSEASARKLVTTLGIIGDPFSEAEVREHKVHI